MKIKLFAAVVAGLAVFYGNYYLNPGEQAVRAQRSARYQCENKLRSTLRDPYSLEVYGWSDNESSFSYSATNGFGGRVRKTHYC